MNDLTLEQQKEILNMYGDGITNSFIEVIDKIGISNFFKTYESTHIKISNYIFKIKAIKILEAFNEVTEQEKNIFLNILQNNQSKLIDFIELIEKIDQIDKALIIKSLLKKRLKNELTEEDFFRYSKITVQIYLNDLIYITKFKKNNNDKITDLIRGVALSSIGILEEGGFTHSRLGGNMNTPRYYVLTKLGETYLQAISHQNK